MRIVRNNSAAGRAAPRRGFTLVELSLGLLTTALVTGALAAFTISIARSWQASGSSQSTSLSSAAATMRIQQIVRNARLTGKCNTGAIDGSSAAAVLIWLEDTNGDSTIQNNECALIEYDLVTRSIIKRTVPSGGSATSMNYSTFSSGGSVLTTFRAVATDTRTLASDIDGAVFRADAGDDSTTLPSLEFELKFQRKTTDGDGNTTDVGSPTIGYGVATVRTPLARPS